MDIFQVSQAWLSRGQVPLVKLVFFFRERLETAVWETRNNRGGDSKQQRWRLETTEVETQNNSNILQEMVAEMYDDSEYQDNGG